MAVCEIKNGKRFICDENLLPVIQKTNWSVIECYPGKSYVMATIKGKTVMLHRFLTHCPKGMEVDHINGNSLDNRMENLRICTSAENKWNTRKRKKKSKDSPKYLGVFKSRGYIVASIKFHRKHINLGYFKDEVTAAKAYDAKARELRGEFAVTNFK